MTITNSTNQSTGVAPMTFKTEIVGLKFYRGEDGKTPFKVLAFAEVVIPEIGISLKGVSLTWSRRRGYVACAPYAAFKSVNVISWSHNCEFAQDLCLKLVAAYRALGGADPAAPVPVEAPLEYRTVPAKFELIGKDEAANDDEAIEGLHRTLCVVQEEVRRAVG